MTHLGLHRLAPLAGLGASKISKQSIDEGSSKFFPK